MAVPAHRDERLWSVDDLSDYLGVPVATLYRWRYIRYGPKGMRVGRYIRYRKDDVIEWLDAITDAA